MAKTSEEMGHTWRFKTQESVRSMRRSKKDPAGLHGPSALLVSSREPQILPYLRDENQASIMRP